jgi:hypothetical protein
MDSIVFLVLPLRSPTVELIWAIPTLTLCNLPPYGNKL